MCALNNTKCIKNLFGPSLTVTWLTEGINNIFLANIINGHKLNREIMPKVKCTFYNVMPLIGLLLCLQVLHIIIVTSVAMYTHQGGTNIL